MRKLCLTLCLVLVLAPLFSVSVFAAAAEYDLNLEVGDTLFPGRYRFVEVIVPGVVDPTSINGSYAIRLPFVSNGQGFDYFSVYFGSSTEERYFRLLYYQPGSLVPYTVDDGWISAAYRTIDVYESYIVPDQIRCDFLNSNLKLLYRFGSGDGLGLDILSLFDNVSDGIVGLIGTLVSLFWVDGSFTFFGALSVLALAISVSLLLFYIFLRFLKFRG